MPCWSNRQRRYGQKNPEHTLKIKRDAAAKRKASWSEERKEIERSRQYNRWLKKKYGITLEDYDQILLSQSSCCAICKQTEPNGKGVFHVDHCHTTGKVRGVLCAKCNILLGHADDNTKILMSAIKYLNDHKPENRAKEGGKKF